MSQWINMEPFMHVHVNANVHVHDVPASKPEFYFSSLSDYLVSFF